MSLWSFLGSHNKSDQFARPLPEGYDDLVKKAFLPIAFCRKLLPELEWPKKYLDQHAGNNKLERLFKDNGRYVAMEQETEKYWNETPNNEWVLNIAGRSAEFHAINQLLNDGGKLEDAKLTETYVMR
jgi:hypothetical protein